MNVLGASSFGIASNIEKPSIKTVPIIFLLLIVYSISTFVAFIWQTVFSNALTRYEKNHPELADSRHVWTTALLVTFISVMFAVLLLFVVYHYMSKVNNSVKK
jgi:heme/copper-type cytochrome/quinol oxidase subunit 2